MLLRFLGIATLSVTVLTVKAMDNTEAYVPPLETPAEISYEIVYTTPVINQTAAYNHEAEEPSYTGSVDKGYMPASHNPASDGNGIARHLGNGKKQVAGYQRTPPLPVRLRSNADDVKDGIANLLGRKLASKKPIIRHAYLPPSHNFETNVAETATDAAPTNILSSLETPASVTKEKGRIAKEVEALIQPPAKAKTAKAAIKKRFKKSKRAATPKIRKHKAVKRNVAQKKKLSRKKKYAAAKKQRRKAARKYRFDYLAAFN